MPKDLNSICIVGGGTAGWMAATLLSTVLKASNIKITLIESPDINTVGVGESTVPSMMDFLRASQINLKEFIQATSATFKLGIRFDDWLTQGENYFHPFGRVGQGANGFDFYQLWLQSVSDGKGTGWLDHAPSAVMAQNERFMLRPQQPENWVHSSFSHALHFDAVQVARYLRTIAVKRGVHRVEATVDSVTLNSRGGIEALKLNNESRINSDFYIDCTGFKGLLIEEAMGVGYEEWSNYLLCDRAVVVQTENITAPKPYTIATALDAGWMWQIPLQNRTGNGYVFSSQYCSDDNALNTLTSKLKSSLLNEPKVIPFVPGRRKKIWHNNCLALGLAAGFVEPLESTAIHLVYKSLTHFIKHFPDNDFEPYNEQAFNQKVNFDYEEVRNFIILHYCTTQRSDSDFWRWCQNMPVPDSLREKINLFKQRGQIEHTPGQLFSHDSWCSIFEGMKIRPKKNHPLLSGFNPQQLHNMMTNNVNNIHSSVMNMPAHQEYIKQHCAVTEPLELV